MIILALLLSVLLLARANGANDNFKATAALYGSGALGHGAARVLATAAPTLVDRLHVLSAFAPGFARALNDTPEVLGLLIAPAGPASSRASPREPWPWRPSFPDSVNSRPCAS